MVFSTESRVDAPSSFGGIPEVHLEDSATDDQGAGHPSGISFRRVAFRAVATTSVLFVIALASFRAISVASSFSGAPVESDAGKGLVPVELAEVAREGDILIRVCRNTNCDKFHPHGLVHEYTAFLNQCSEVGSKGSPNRNGRYEIVGATASTVKPGALLTADHCQSPQQQNGNWNNAVYHSPVYHGPFELKVGDFSDCCSFEHGGCGFKCITFPLNEVPPAYGGDGMDGGDIRIKVCRNEDCDKLHPHGLVHEYTAKLNVCEKVSEDTNTLTNGEYEVIPIGASTVTLAEGTVLTAKQCGNTAGRVRHGDFFLRINEFTDCCNFRQGGCGFKCITFSQKEPLK